MDVRRGWLGIVLVAFFGSAFLAESVKPPQSPLRVLIDSSDPSSERAEGVKSLLERHGARATILTGRDDVAMQAEEFDIAIVMGQASRRSRVGIVRDYQIPVLGYGPFGCDYFGTLKLKNGAPYT